MRPAQGYQVQEQALGLLKSRDANLEGKLIDLHATPSNCVQCGAVTEGRALRRGGDGPNDQIT